MKIPDDNSISPATKGCINNIINNMDTLEKQIEKVEKKVDKLPTRTEMKLANKNLVDEVLAKADRRYADKRTEKLVNYLVAGIFFLGLAITLITLFGQQLPISIGF